MICCGIQHSHAARSIISTGSSVALIIGSSMGVSISVSVRERPSTLGATALKVAVRSVSSSMVAQPVTATP